MQIHIQKYWEGLVNTSRILTAGTGETPSFHMSYTEYIDESFAVAYDVW